MAKDILREVSNHTRNRTGSIPVSCSPIQQHIGIISGFIPRQGSLVSYLFLFVHTSRKAKAWRPMKSQGPRTARALGVRPRRPRRPKAARAHPGDREASISYRPANLRKLFAQFLAQRTPVRFHIGSIPVSRPVSYPGRPDQALPRVASYAGFRFHTLA